MKKVVLFFAFLIITNLYSIGQTRTIQGRVISEDFEELPGVTIENTDSLLIGKTDVEGRFRIEIPQNTEKLIFSWIGMEWTTIQLNNYCDTVEVVMMYDVIYDFMTFRKIDRLRRKRYKELPTIHQNAFEKGIFVTEHQCYVQEFIPITPELDKMKSRTEE